MKKGKEGEGREAKGQQEEGGRVLPSLCRVPATAVILPK